MVVIIIIILIPRTGGAWNFGVHSTSSLPQTDVSFPGGEVEDMH